MTKPIRKRTVRGVFERIEELRGIFPEEIDTICGIGIILKQHRLASKYGIREIHAMSGIDRQTIMAIEKGNPASSILSIMRYAELFKLCFGLSFNAAEYSLRYKEREEAMVAAKKEQAKEKKAQERIRIDKKKELRELGKSEAPEEYEDIPDRISRIGGDLEIE